MEIFNASGLPAYTDMPPIACRAVSSHCASSPSIGRVDHVAGTDNCLATEAMSPGNSQHHMYFAPFASPPFDCGVDRLAIEVTASQVSSSIDIGLFDSAPGMSVDHDLTYPGKMLFTANIDTSSNGLKTADISPSVRLRPGRWYWVGLYASAQAAQPQLRASPVANGISLGLPPAANTLGRVVAINITTPGHVRWGDLPEITANVLAVTTAAMPLLRYRLCE